MPTITIDVELPISVASGARAAAVIASDAFSPIPIGVRASSSLNIRSLAFVPVPVATALSLLPKIRVLAFVPIPVGADATVIKAGGCECAPKPSYINDNNASQLLRLLRDDEEILDSILRVTECLSRGA